MCVLDKAIPCSNCLEKLQLRICEIYPSWILVPVCLLLVVSAGGMACFVGNTDNASWYTTPGPLAMKLRLRDTRHFVESRLKNLQSMFAGEPRLARAEIAQHVQKITLKPAGKTYLASGVWNWLGGVAVRMVPGDRIAPRVRMRLASYSLADGLAIR